MIDTSKLDVMRHETSGKCFVVSQRDNLPIHSYGFETKTGAWAFLAGMAQEQVRQQQAEIKRLKRRITELEGSND